MEVIQMLHMNGGMGDTSYGNNSSLQKRVISMTMPITSEAITSLCCNSLPEKLAIADLGCSSGPNTFFLISELIKAVEKLYKNLNRQSPEYHIFLNDLPGNDFNNVFQSIDSFKEAVRNETLEDGLGTCCINGTPGSFYGRLFPSNTLHFVHSSYSIHWLSQVPKGAENNKGNICMAKSSPPNVLVAYYKQFQKDFSFFLKCRAKELVKGGRMVLTFLGRTTEDRSSNESSEIWELVGMVLSDMVLKGLIEEEQVDSFNIPIYTPSPSEIRHEILNDGSFSINSLTVSRVNWDSSTCTGETETGKTTISSSDEMLIARAYRVAKCMRAVMEPLLVTQFSEAIIEEVFQRYHEIVTDRMSKDKTELINVTVSVTKKAS